MSLAVAAARWIHTSTAEWPDPWRFDPLGVTGNVHVYHLPDDHPGPVVAVIARPGFAPVASMPGGTARLQLVVRGAAYDDDPAPARRLFGLFHRADLVTFDAGGDTEEFISGVSSTQTEPEWLGRDDQQRSRWSLNFDVETNTPPVPITT